MAGGEVPEYDFQMRALNPELYHLVQRVKAIYAIVGGEGAKMPKGKKLNDFDMKKSVFIAHLHNVDKLVDTRDNGGLTAGTRDHIRVKNAISIEMRGLKGELDEIIGLNTREVEKRGTKMAAEEIRARKGVIDALAAEYHNLFKRVTGYADAAAPEMLGGGVGMATTGVADFKKGTYAGAGVKTAKEELSGEHMMKLEQIRKVRAEQDAILDEMLIGLDDLTEAATRIQDELQLQEKMLSDLDAKTDRAQDKLDGTMKRLTGVMKMANDKSSNFCLYGICLVILLAVGVIIYNMLTKK